MTNRFESLTPKESIQMKLRNVLIKLAVSCFKAAFLSCFIYMLTANSSDTLNHFIKQGAKHA